MTRPREHDRRTARSFPGAVGAIPFLVLIALPLAVLLISPVGARTAGAQEAQRGIEVGDGVVSIDGGKIYAGNGCAKAGNVVAGDCEGEDKTDDGGKAPSVDGSPDDPSQETTVVRGSTPAEEPRGLATTFSETTSPEGTVADGAGADSCPEEPPDDAVEARVERAVDGDTLELDREVGGTDRVRLIGVDTPELEGENGQPEPYAEEAESFTAGALEGENVLLRVGEDETDEYERLLAYVWRPAGEGLFGSLQHALGIGGPELFNETLLEQGYARVLTIEPNDAYTRCFEAAEVRAREDQAGLWGLQSGPSAEQYDAGDGPQTTLERTVPEETGLQRSTARESASQGTTNHTPVAREGAPAEDQYGADDPRAGAPTSVPDYRECDDPHFLAGIVGGGERTESVEVPGESFLLAYRTRAVLKGEDGPLIVDVYGPGEAGDAPGGAPVEEISYDKVGTGRTYVEAGPGTFEVAASSEGRGYHIAVYACGEDVTEAGARDAAPEETEPPRSDPASSSSSAEQAALPLTTGLADAPVEGPMRSADFGPVAAGTSVAGPGGLTHLPETGGAGLLGLVLGVLCFAGGTLAFALKARGRRREDG